MRNLTIDIGNTLSKVAVFEHGEEIYFKTFTLENFSEKLKNILKEYPQTSNLIISSVSKDVKTLLEEVPKHIQVLELSATTPVPFRNLYKTPHSLGIDRIALVVGAVKEFLDKDVLIIDAGTCITYDIVTKKKEYLGGIISPGINMRLQAMHNFTSKLPLVSINEKINVNITGTTTQENLEIGAVMGTVMEIDGFIERYKLQYQDLTVILTGGDSQLLSKKVKNSIFAPYNFLLKGLNHILEFNTTK